MAGRDDLHHWPAALRRPVVDRASARAHGSIEVVGGASQVRRETGPESLDPWERCITRGLPAVMLPSAANNYLQIVQPPRYVSIVTEMIHEARAVPLDGQAFPPRSVRAWIGYSRGRWEGDTLVIE